MKYKIFSREPCETIERRCWRMFDYVNGKNKGAVTYFNDTKIIMRPINDSDKQEMTGWEK